MFATKVFAPCHLNAIYHGLRGDLLRFAHARTGDPAQAEDIVQDVWLKLQTGDFSRVQNPRTYLFQMVRNIVIDQQREFARRQKRDQLWRHWRTGYSSGAGDISDAAADIEASLIEMDEARQLHEAIARLPQGARRVLHLHKIEGLSHAEVAQRLAISKSGVEKHMAVAMRQLREAMLD